MMSIRNQRARHLSAWLVALFMLASPLGALAQTRVQAPSNKYSVQDDVKVGQQAAQEVYQQMPILRDQYIDNYVESVGRRLVEAIPAEFQHSGFRYTFDVVNARDINAFALPGGPMFVNRGMIEAARTEGEMAGVMAHEISHVALRHGTAQASKAGSVKAQAPAIGGAILGAILGGVVGGIAQTAGQVGSAAIVTKYSREYETQADILGAQIMARAGYDPRDLANMFRTIERQGGGRGGPEWLSSHPNPGNRYERINQEASLLRVSPGSGTQDSRAFQQAQARLRGQGTAPSMEEIARGGQRYPNQGGQNDSYGSGGRVEYPSASYRTDSNNVFRVSVPSNWRQVGGGESAIYAPEGAYGSQGITHGVMFGGAQSNARDLQGMAREVVEGLLQGNNYLRQSGGYQRTSIDGREAYATTLIGRSPITGRNEQVTIVVTQLAGGNAFYMAAVAPANEYGAYRRTFDSVLRSVQLNTRY